MRSKAPLALMEQAVMVLVFALAAAVCLRAFVWSDQTSRQNETRDRAAAEVQTVAETIKWSGRQGGDDETVLARAAEKLGSTFQPYGAEGAAIELRYDDGWTAYDTGAYTYSLRAEAVDSGVPGLEMARVWACGWDRSGEYVLFEVDVAWQGEVD